MNVFTNSKGSIRVAAAVAVAGLAATGAVALSGPQAQAASLANAHPTVRAVPTCTSGDLSARYRHTDAATSHVYGVLVLRNVSGQACRTGGYAGLSYVGHGDGTQVGAAARRDTSAGAARSIVLKPGQHARSQVSEASYAAYPARRCHATHVDGFRVYVPGETRAKFVAHRTTTCANRHLHLLTERPLR